MNKIILYVTLSCIALGNFTVNALGATHTKKARSESISDSVKPSQESKYYGAELCQYPQFLCMPVKNSYSWYSLWPNAQQRLIVQRLNRSNVSISDRPWVVVPRNLANINEMELSPFPGKRNTNGNRLIIVSLSRQAFGAYNENGNLVKWGPASSARGYCADVHRRCTTPTGRFSIVDKQGAGCISHRFPIATRGGAKMPYCMFFHKGFALHGSYELPGYNDSHGCVRLYPEDARWLNQEFTSIGTPVIVMN